MNRLITLLVCLSAAVAAHAQGFLLPSRPNVDSTLAPFFHGVASGDPMADRIILWTRVTTEDNTVSVDWQIATDTGFTNVVNSGTLTTDTSKDHTVKVDATGLSGNTITDLRRTTGTRLPVVRVRRHRGILTVSALLLWHVPISRQVFSMFITI
jgi:phosphodiesterase/alkaline phosphatase D-like protein